MTRPQQYYVVNAGRGRSATHIMRSTSASTPHPLSPGSIIAELLWFGGVGKETLCGLIATRHVDVFRPSEASCRECRKRWQLATQGAPAPKSAAPGPATAELEPAFNLLARTSSQLRQAGIRDRGWRRYSVMSPQEQRAWLARHPDAAARLFPGGIPDGAMHLHDPP